MSDDARVLRLCDLNLAEWYREHARLLSPFSIEERDGLLLTASGTRFPAPPFNVVMRVPYGELDAAAVIEQARTFFAARGRGFSVQTRGHADQDLIDACQAAGMFSPGGRTPGMICSARVEAAKLGDGVDVRTVTLDTAKDFVNVSAFSYEQTGLPITMAHKVLSQAERWLAPHWHVRVLYARDEPVCAALLLFSHGIAGVYWVGTVPSARGKGYAETLMRVITNHAFDSGASFVSLQASVMGEPVYKRIGYREVTRYGWFMSPMNA